MFKVSLLLIAIAFQPGMAGTAQVSTAENPMRKIITMLQDMAAELEREGEVEKEIFEKALCTCEGGTAELTKVIDDSTAAIEELTAKVKAGEAEKTQLGQEVGEHKATAASAKSDLDEATMLREKENKKFVYDEKDTKSNIAAMAKAVTSIEKGQSGFLQTPAATVLKRLALSTEISLEARDTLTAFLSEGSSAEAEDSDSYEPASGEISGILKQMQETMEKDVAEASAAETASIADFDALMAAKAKETEALTKEIETKIARIGETGVQLVNQKEDLDDTTKSLAEDTKFLKNLETTCKTKTAEYEAREKTRSEELVALADTIKLLNDDDALELFKKTIPSASSFLQMQVTSKEVLKQARKVLHPSLKVRDYRLDLISMAMQGKKVNFDKVMAMIDDMVALLKKEQVDDGKKKAYCAKAFDEAEDEQKELSRTEGDLEKTIADEKELIETLVEELSSLTAGMKSLDKSVAEATANRKSENAAYVEELAASNAAIEIIGIAKNRMNKFYNPKLYKEVPTTPAPAFVQDEQTEPEFVQISAHVQKSATHGDANGVIAMMDTLIADVQKEITEMKVDEKHAQADYEEFMADSSEKRAADAKSVAEKEAAKADTSAKLQKHNEELKATLKELYANGKYTHDLHGECDWLVQNYGVRKSARADEVDALTKAKAVLSGADYSF